MSGINDSIAQHDWENVWVFSGPLRILREQGESPTEEKLISLAEKLYSTFLKSITIDENVTDKKSKERDEAANKIIRTLFPDLVYNRVHLQGDSLEHFIWHLCRIDKKLAEEGSAPYCMDRIKRWIGLRTLNAISPELEDARKELTEIFVEADKKRQAVEDYTNKVRNWHKTLLSELKYAWGKQNPSVYDFQIKVVEDALFRQDKLKTYAVWQRSRITREERITDLLIAVDSPFPPNQVKLDMLPASARPKQYKNIKEANKYIATVACIAYPGASESSVLYLPGESEDKNRKKAPQREKKNQTEKNERNLFLQDMRDAAQLVVKQLRDVDIPNFGIQEKVPVYYVMDVVQRKHPEINVYATVAEAVRKGVIELIDTSMGLPAYGKIVHLAGQEFRLADWIVHDD